MSVVSQGILGLGLQRRARTGKGPESYQPRGGVTFQRGSLVIRRLGSTLAEIPLSTAPIPGAVLLGYYNGNTPYAASSTNVDGNGGEIDPNTGSKTSISISPLSASGTEDFATGTGSNQITVTMVDQPCFISDDDTYYPTDLAGTLPWGGYVEDVDTNTGRVTVKHSAQLRQLYELYAAGTAAFGYTADDTANYVITNLPTGTWSSDGSTFTVSATGAMPTQDTNIIPAADDKAIFQLGTLTTQAVTAAHVGVYECTNPGATGVQAVWTRTARWAQGAVLQSGTKIKVTGQNAASSANAAIWTGTTWRSDPATAGLLVGTGDPALFPEKVNVAGTCASGTFTISSVPLRAAGKFSILVDFTGGSPAATTTSLQASTQTPGGIGTASIVVQEQSHLGTLVNTGSATGTVTVLQ